MSSSLSRSFPAQVQLVNRMLSAAASTTATTDTRPIADLFGKGPTIAYIAPYQQRRSVPWAKPVGDPRSIRPGSFTASCKALHCDPRLVAVQPFSE